MIIRWLLAIVLAANTLIYGQGQAITLQEIITSAMQNSVALQATADELAIEELEQKTEHSDLGPQVHLNSQYYYYWSEVPQFIYRDPESSVISNGAVAGSYPVFVGGEHNFISNLSVSQRLFDKRLINRNTQLESLKQVASLKEQEEMERVVLEISDRYLQWVSLSIRTSQLTFNEKRLRTLMQISQKRISQGMALGIDSIRIQKALADLAIERQRITSASSLLLEALQTESGLVLDSSTIEINAFQTPFFAINEPPSGSSSKQQLLEGYKNLQKQQELRQSLLWNTTLDVYGNLVWNYQAAESGFWNTPSTVGLAFRIPFAEGGRWLASKQKVLLQQELLTKRQEQLETGEALQRQQIESEIEYNQQKLLAESSWMQQLEKELAFSQEKLDTGLATIRELLALEDELVRSQQKVADWTQRLRKSELTYLQLSGQLLAKFSIQ